MATNLYATKKRVYCFRLQNLVIEGGAYVIREVLDHLTGVPLTVHLQNNGTNITHPKIRSQPGQTKSLTQTQYAKLFVSPGTPSPSVTSADLDITLLVYLLQKTCRKCGLKKETDQIWFTNPTPNDQKIEHDIVRMRHFRNELSHRESNLISLQEFQLKWQEIETVLLRLYRTCSSNTQNLQVKFDEFKSATVDEEADERNEQILEEWAEMDKCVQSTLMILQKDLRGINNDVQELKNKDPPRLATLKDISERYFRRMSKTKDVFVRTATYNKAAEKLNKSGIVILSGYAGEGKTTLASQLLLESCPLDKILKLSVPSDMIEFSTKDWNGILIDDFLGTTVLEQDNARHWNDYLRDLLHDAHTMRLSVVMATRQNILSEANDRLNLDLFKEENIIYVSSSDLTKEEKMKILNNHLKDSRPLTTVPLNACILNWKDTEYKVGFPECAVMFASNDTLFEKGPSFFASPFEFFQKFMTELSKNEDEFMILVLLWTKQSKRLSKFDLEHGNLDSLTEIANALCYDLKKKSKTLRKALQHHKDGILCETDKNDEYSFSHNIIGEVVGLVLSKDNPDLAIQYGTKSFILKYVTTNYSVNECVIVDERRFSILGKRLNELLFEGGDVFLRDAHNAYRTFRTGVENMCAVKGFPDISILDHEVFSNEKFIKKYVSLSNGIDIISAPVLEVFEHFRNPYNIVFGNGEMGICIPGVLLAVANTRMVEECIQRKILTDREKYIALLIATRDNNETLVRKLLQANAEVNEDTLQIAVVNEHIAILKSLLPKSNCSRSHIQKGNSPLITATKRGLFKIVRCLLQNGVDINHRNVQGQSALDKAIVCNEFNICAALIQKGCQLDVKAGKFDRTPLHAAVDMGNIEIVELLLNNRASIDTTDHRGENPIHTAALRGNMKILRLLLNEDKSLAMNRFKFQRQITTLYHYAVNKENKDLLQILIEHDIDLNMQDQFGRTPLYFAVYYSKPEFVELMLEKADVTLAENNGYTPLHAAVFNLNTALVKMLCKYYTDIRMVDRKGNSVFHVLKNVSKGQIGNDTCVRVSECIKILLRKDNDFEIYLKRMQNKKGEIVNLMFARGFYFVL
ncbi:uncharacterized protein LOC132713693 [Ruditapes philippinarum]|uniref:uncharacterized protein LOC132713693 n=1 Tax=Ruditapes philippinarum TaxID=129788 RepID=UPI00295B6C37|nr:uncharacterized protein LOC132713693 [Ruditapes philippinarum]XP_060552349.1 uncharacterized protein LOC132713693 [Ruditapes philippinarum]